MENNLSIVQDKFKELPNNLEAEQSVIGSILLTNEIFDEINTIISNKNFITNSKYNSPSFSFSSHYYCHFAAALLLLPLPPHDISMSLHFCIYKGIEVLNLDLFLAEFCFSRATAVNASICSS